MSRIPPNVELLAASMPCHVERGAFGSALHWDELYSFGSIHQHRCVKQAETVAAEYRRLVGGSRHGVES